MHNMLDFIKFCTHGTRIRNLLHLEAAMLSHAMSPSINYWPPIQVTQLTGQVK